MELMANRKTQMEFRFYIQTLYLSSSPFFAAEAFIFYAIKKQWNFNFAIAIHKYLLSMHSCCHCCFFVIFRTHFPIYGVAGVFTWNSYTDVRDNDLGNWALNTHQWWCEQFGESKFNLNTIFRRIIFTSITTRLFIHSMPTAAWKISKSIPAVSLPLKFMTEALSSSHKLEIKREKKWNEENERIVMERITVDVRKWMYERA